MSIVNTLSTVGKIFDKVRQVTRANRSTIQIVSSVAALIACGVDACVQSQKLPEVIDEVKEDIENTKKLKENIEPDNMVDEDGRHVVPKYSSFNYYRDLFKSYLRGVWRLTKMYGIPIVGTIISVLGIFGAYKHVKIEADTNKAAFVALYEMYNNYRENVRNTYGDIIDRDFAMNAKRVVDEYPVLDKNGNQKVDKNGNPKTAKSEYKEIGADYNDPKYILWCPETAPFDYDNTTEDPKTRVELNVSKLMIAEDSMNEKLRREGVVFINHVAKELGVKPREEWQVLGWSKAKGFDGEVNRISFNIMNFDGEDGESRMRFMKGLEDGILLELNHCGYVADYYPNRSGICCV